MLYLKTYKVKLFLLTKQTLIIMIILGKVILLIYKRISIATLALHWKLSVSCRDPVGMTLFSTELSNGAGCHGELPQIKVNLPGD